MAKRFWEYPLPVGYDEYAISARTIMLNYRLRCAGLIQEREELLVSSIVKQVFVDNGVPAEEFDGAVDSFAVSGMVSQFDRNTESYNVRGVPAFLVNGKYMVKIESITSQEQFNQLVQFLLAKKD
jgi:thiol:disulfide interchange protein DsbA